MFVLIPTDKYNPHPSAGEPLFRADGYYYKNLQVVKMESCEAPSKPSYKTLLHSSLREHCGGVGRKIILARGPASLLRGCVS